MNTTAQKIAETDAIFTEWIVTLRNQAAVLRWIAETLAADPGAQPASVSSASTAAAAAAIVEEQAHMAQDRLHAWRASLTAGHGQIDVAPLFDILATLMLCKEQVREAEKVLSRLGHI
jgi:hypothetical protein